MSLKNELGPRLKKIISIIIVLIIGLIVDNLFPEKGYLLCACGIGLFVAISMLWKHSGKLSFWIICLVLAAVHLYIIYVWSIKKPILMLPFMTTFAFINGLFDYFILWILMKLFYKSK